MTNYPDCSPETMGIPDLGEPNVTYPDWKVREQRRAYYAAVSFMDEQVQGDSRDHRTHSCPWAGGPRAGGGGGGGAGGHHRGHVRG